MILRRRNVGKCSCKVGSCRKCGSACKRCSCDCDGISPIEAIARHRGAQLKRKRGRNKKVSDGDKKSYNLRNRSLVNKEDSSLGLFNDGVDECEFIANVYDDETSSESSDSNCSNSKLQHGKKSMSRMRRINKRMKMNNMEKNKSNQNINASKVNENNRKNAQKVMTSARNNTPNAESIITVVGDVHNYNLRNTLECSVVGSVGKNSNVSSRTLRSRSVRNVGNVRADINKNNNSVHPPNIIIQTPNNNRSEINDSNDLSVADSATGLTELTNDQPSRRITRLTRRTASLRNNTIHNNTIRKSRRQHNNRNVASANTEELSIIDTRTTITEISNDKTRFIDTQSRGEHSSQQSRFSGNIPNLPDFPLQLNNYQANTSPFFGDSMCDNIKKIGELIDYFKVPGHYKSNLPSLKLRAFSGSLASQQFSRFRRMVTLVTSCIDKMSLVICPGPSRPELLRCVAKSIKIANLKLISAEQDNTNETVLDYKQMYERLADTVCIALKHQKKRSTEKRVLGAILYKGTTYNNRSALLRKHNMTFARGQPEVQAIKDFEAMKLGNVVEKTVASYSHKSDSVIQKAVDYVLSEKFTAPSSFGMHEVVISANEKISLPNIMRKQSRTEIVAAYKNHTKDEPSRIGRNTMFAIMNATTTCDEKVLMAIDYVTSILVNETCEVLQTIIDRCIHPSLKDTATSLVHTTKNFLKHQYGDHVSIPSDSICFHGLKYGLDTKCQPKSGHNCIQCSFPFYTCDELKKMVISSPCESNDMIQDAKKVIMDIKMKFKLYMAHVCRKRLQTEQISSREMECKKLCEQSKGKHIKAVAIMDFKMKFETKSSRESSVEHFGKRGMGWHGFALSFFLWEKNNEGVFVATKYIVYIDQIIQQGNKQDAFAVLALLEAALRIITQDLPYITEIILQSDNAATYQNHFLTVGIHQLNCNFKGNIFISEYVHSETQDGKTILDAHFGSSVHHLNKFMRVWRPNVVTRIQTPNGLGYALTNSGGLTNTIVQLINIERTKLDTIKNQINPVVDKLKLYMSRINQLYFDKDNINSPTASNVFNFEVMAFSGIGRRIKFFVDLSKGTAKPDEQSLRTIDQLLNRNCENTNTVDATQEQTQDVGANENVVDNEITINPNVAVDENIVSHNNDIELQESDKCTHNSNENVIHNEITQNQNVCLAANENVEPSNVLPDDSSESSEATRNSSDSSYDDSEDSESDLEGVDMDLTEENDEMRKWQDVSNDYEVNPNQSYTGVSVIKQLSLGIPKPHQHSAQDQTTNSINNVTSSKNTFRNDTIAKAIRYAANVITSSRYYVDCQSANNPIYNEASQYEMPEEDLFKPGWALREKRGELYGNSYVQLYKTDLKEMFQRGEQNSSNKMNAAQMREALAIKYPIKFSIPGETEIKTYIGAEFQKSKYTRKNQSGDGRGRKPNNRSKPRWHVLIEKCVEYNGTGKPEEIYNQFLQGMTQEPEVNDVPTKDGKIDKEVIKRKISQHKQKIRKHAMMQTLFA